MAVIFQTKGNPAHGKMQHNYYLKSILILLYLFFFGSFSDRSRSEEKNDRSRSGSVNNHSPDRNESMED